jgi:hypothetical protein
MSCLLITYDLNKPGQNYDDLYEVIKNLGSHWWHYMDSTWLVASTLTPDQAVDRLKGVVDGSDRLLVIDVKGDSRQGLLTEDAWDWIKKYM